MLVKGKLSSFRGEVFNKKVGGLELMIILNNLFFLYIYVLCLFRVLGNIRLEMN